MNIHNDNYQNTCDVIFFFQYDASHFCIIHSWREQRLVNLIYLVFTDEISNLGAICLAKKIDVSTLPYPPKQNFRMILF